jgi:uncharacterized protein YkwD
MVPPSLRTLRSLHTLLPAAALAALLPFGSARAVTPTFAAPPDSALNSPPGLTLNAPLDATAGPTTQTGALDITAAEAQFLDLLNADRTANGLPALQADPRLMDVARWRSEDMVTRNYFGHDIGGYVVSQVLKDRQISFRLAGENIADATYDDIRTVPAAETGLLNSPGHRVNILRGDFNYVGVGIAAAPNGRVVLTQIFIQV